MGKHTQGKMGGVLPSSPLGRVFAQPELETIGCCAMGLKYPIDDIDAIKTAISDSTMLKHPLFTSLLVKDRCKGYYWKRSTVNMDDHIIIHDDLGYYSTAAAADDNREETDRILNKILEDLSVPSSPMSRDKPLWEFHVLLGLNCVVLRAHHAVGDGVSMMSMLSECFGSRKKKKGELGGGEGVGDQRLPGGGGGGVMKQNKKKKKSRQWRERGVKGWVKSVWYTCGFLMVDLAKLLWMSDERTVISGGDGVQLWPRKLVTVKFDLEDMKKIKQAIPKATINDVFMGVTSCGLSKYINLHDPDALRKSRRVNSVFMVNVRDEPEIEDVSGLMKSGFWSGWGNRIGVFLLPLFLSNQGDHLLHPLEHVRRMKSILDKKKQSYEADFIYSFIRITTTLFGAKAGSWIFQRFLLHTTILNSNVRGPQEEIEIAGNPVTYMRVNISGLPHAIVMHMVSYAGRVELQALVAKDIIQQPESLAKCFQESLHEMINSMPTSTS